VSVPGGLAHVATRREQNLARKMKALIEVTEDLRSVLLAYKRVSAQVVERVEKGHTLVAALEALRGPIRRRAVTEAVENFEGARHAVRVAMFALGQENGTSASELGRQLGISRQLSARLAKEAEELA